MGGITKAVIPAAGLGTRFLPATKALPKEMLPVVDKPAIQYVVEEAVNSGLTHLLMITGRNKNALENHFDRVVELEYLFENKGDNNRLDLISESSDLADIHYVRQGTPLGLGHAISKAETFTGNEAFAVLLGDELIRESDPLLSKMCKLAEEHNATIVALLEVPLEEISLYGVADFSAGHQGSETIELQGLVEKPSKDSAPSNLAVVGRYILQPSIYRALENIKPGLGGELQLTDALDLMTKNPDIYGPVIGFVFTGKRYDTGDRLSYLKTTVELASERKDIGPLFNSWLKRFAENL